MSMCFACVILVVKPKGDAACIGRVSARLFLFHICRCQVPFPNVYANVTRWYARLSPSLPSLNDYADMSELSMVAVTRIACFRFRAHVTGEEKGERTRACKTSPTLGSLVAVHDYCALRLIGVVLALYEQHEHLLAEKPRGGRPMDTPLKLTNVKREKVWDTGFVVKFKASGFREDGW